MSPETAVYYFEKAKLCYNLGEIDNSEVHAEKTLELDSTYKDAHVLLGRIYLAIPNFGMALDEFNAALRLDKNFAEPYFYKGMTYAIAGDTTKAVSSFVTATEQYSEYYEAYIELGLIYAQHSGEDRKLADQYFDNALEIKPNSIEALLAKGISSQDNGDYVMADSCYKLVLNVDPMFEVAYYNMGYVHLLSYRDDAPKEYNDSIIILALEDFSSAIEINDLYVTAYYNRGLCYSLIDDVNSAKVDYATAVKLEPSFAMAQEALNSLK
jgi:tetratricopeptide (TPR) repeat protein